MWISFTVKDPDDEDFEADDVELEEEEGEELLEPFLLLLHSQLAIPMDATTPTAVATITVVLHAEPLELKPLK